MLYPVGLVPSSHNTFARYRCCSRRINTSFPLAYSALFRDDFKVTNYLPTGESICNVLPILKSACIEYHAPDAEDIPESIIPSQITLASVSVLLYSGIPAHTTTPILNSSINMVNKPHCDTLMGSSIVLICINDVLSSIFSWTKYGNCGSITWETIQIFTSQSISCIFQLLFPKEDMSIIASSDDIVTKTRSMNLNPIRI